METFSNDPSVYFDQIKKELLTLPIKTINDLPFCFLEIGHRYTHGFSISLLNPNSHKLYLKVWNAPYDNDRFDQGIYNLDRLAITEYFIDLPKDTLKTITQLLQSNPNLVEHKSITLDGLFCQLNIGQTQLNWNGDHEINVPLLALIELLRELVYDKLKGLYSKS